MAKRVGLSVKTRFEVFKRDKFKCQYCGKSAPDVILNVDHIKPVASGGKNTMTNLITSCFDCNSGKGKRELSDDSEVSKQKAQLDDLQERRNQIDMMMQWHSGLSDMVDHEAISFIEAFEKKCNCEFINRDPSIVDVKKWLKNYSLSELLAALDASASQYLTATFSGSNKQKVWDYIPRIARSTKTISEKPHMADVFKLTGYAKKNLYQVPSYGISASIEALYLRGASIEDMKHAINKCHYYRDFIRTVEEELNTNGS